MYHSQLNKGSTIVKADLLLPLNGSFYFPDGNLCIILLKSQMCFHLVLTHILDDFSECMKLSSLVDWLSLNYNPEASQQALRTSPTHIVQITVMYLGACASLLAENCTWNRIR